MRVNDHMYDNIFKSSNTIIIYRQILVDCFWKRLYSKTCSALESALIVDLYNWPWQVIGQPRGEEGRLNVICTTLRDLTSSRWESRRCTKLLILSQGCQGSLASWIGWGAGNSSRETNNPKVMLWCQPDLSKHASRCLKMGDSNQGRTIQKYIQLISI